ncbi:excalibur calcium-binding domain-containing protein [Cellulomonas sp. JH27-2]|nr:excalibur calcium-binding domain-containing protein [Cellulomonas sp. JH27-2]
MSVDGAAPPRRILSTVAVITQHRCADTSLVTHLEGVLVRRTLAAVVTAAALLVVPAAAAQAAPVHTAAHATSYKNCTALHKKYAGGVAKSSKVHNTKTSHGKKVRAASTYKPKVSAALYAANKKLDRDKDGIACER